MAPKVHSSFDVKNPYGETVAPKMGPGDPGFVVDGGLTSAGGLGFGSGADVVASIGKKQREMANFVASRTDKYAGFDSEIGFNAAGRVLDKDGGDFNTVGLQGAHDYSATEAGRFILEEKRKFEAAKAAMSETRVRDADGTIDRVDDSVAEALMPLLFAIKERCRTEHINLESVFEVRLEAPLPQPTCSHMLTTSLQLILSEARNRLTPPPSSPLSRFHRRRVAPTLARSSARISSRLSSRPSSASSSRRRRSLRL